MSESLPGPAEDWVKIWRASGRSLSGSEQLIELLVESEDTAVQQRVKAQEHREVMLSVIFVAVCIVVVLVLGLLIWRASGAG